MDPRRAFAEAHLKLRLGPIHRALRAAVERQSARITRLAHPEVAASCIMPDHVALLLGDVDAWCHDPRPPAPMASTTDEAQGEAKLRARAAALGVTLPLDRLATALTLADHERAAVTLCAAVELEPSYERIIAYLLDDTQRRAPCAELFATLGVAPSSSECLAAFECHGTLRTHGVLEAIDGGEPTRAQPLRLTATARAWLLGGRGRVEAFTDPAVVPPDATPLPAALDPARVFALADAIRRGELDAVGVWGGTPDDRARVIAALATARPLRRARADASAAERAVAVSTALARDEGIWLTACDHPGAEPAVEAWLRAPVALIVLDAADPQRPDALLGHRRHAEWQARPATLDERRALWRAALPELSSASADAHARRYHLGAAAVDAIAALTRRESRLGGDDDPTAHLATACALVIRRRSERFAEWVTPHRRAPDLVLPPALHRRVLDLVRFARADGTLTERWRGHDAPGARGLFTGPPGTGKTLAAEVIAGELGIGLMRVDLARVVSKWLGETEKNLEAAFAEAEASHAVLFFDEAEALFGKRGDIKGGTDRYANLEVAYLLQRLERHRGVVILASNLKQQIDGAFMRRFDVVAHFARPERDERRRLWQCAFPLDTPVADDIDGEALASLDLTGADIHRAARTAAFLADDEGSPMLAMRHIVRAVERHYVQSSRVLRPGEFGVHARWLEEH